jgi:hypothetical protein
MADPGTPWPRLDSKFNYLQRITPDQIRATNAG